MRVISSMWMSSFSAEYCVVKSIHTESRTAFERYVHMCMLCVLSYTHIRLFHTVQFTTWTLCRESPQRCFVLVGPFKIETTMLSTVLRCDSIELFRIIVRGWIYSHYACEIYIFYMSGSENARLGNGYLCSITFLLLIREHVHITRNEMRTPVHTEECYASYIEPGRTCLALYVADSVRCSRLTSICRLSGASTAVIAIQ